jgi:hypothetical protein
MNRKPKILFHGNCQSMAFAAGLSEASGFEIMVTPGLWQITPDKIHEVRSFAREADLVVSMPILEREKWDGLSAKQLMEICSCPFVIHPNAHFEGYFPTFGICYYESGLHIPIHSKGNPTSDYLCFLCYALFTLGIDADGCHRALEANCFIPSIQEYYNKSLSVLASREGLYAVEYNRTSKCVFVPISDLIEDARETARCFDSMNHPSGPFLEILLRRILGRADDEFGMDFPWIVDLLSQIGAMSIVSPVLPIYPFVARSLNYEAGARSGLTYTNKPDSINQKEVVTKAYDFFESLNEEDRMAIEKSPKFEFSIEIAKALLVHFKPQ